MTDEYPSTPEARRARTLGLTWAQYQIHKTQGTLPTPGEIRRVYRMFGRTWGAYLAALAAGTIEPSRSEVWRARHWYGMTWETYIAHLNEGNLPAPTKGRRPRAKNGPLLHLWRELLRLKRELHEDEEGTDNLLSHDRPDVALGRYMGGWLNESDKSAKKDAGATATMVTPRNQARGYLAALMFKVKRAAASSTSEERNVRDWLRTAFGDSDAGVQAFREWADQPEVVVVAQQPETLRTAIEVALREAGISGPWPVFLGPAGNDRWTLAVGFPASGISLGRSDLSPARIVDEVRRALNSLRRNRT